MKWDGIFLEAIRDNMSHRKLTSRDHYVSQTYLKHFSCHTGYVFIYRKKEKLAKEVPIKSICYEKGGDICEDSTNKFSLRDLLAEIEPLWNNFIYAMKQRRILETNLDYSSTNQEPSFLGKISLFLSYLRCLSPEVNRLGKKRQELIANKTILPLLVNVEDDRLDEITRESIRNGGYEAQIGNDQYYKGMGAKVLSKIATELYNRQWEILENTTDIKFVTSDTPLIPLVKPAFIERRPSLYLPLTPSHALLMKRGDSAINYKNINRRAEIKEYNKEITKSAADIIISSSNDSGIAKLVDRYRDHETKIEFAQIAGQIVVWSTTGSKDNI